MAAGEISPNDAQRELLREAAGYLNFSSGATDGKFLRAINELHSAIEQALVASHEPGEPDVDSLATLVAWLGARVDELAAEGGAFADATQARAVVGMLAPFRESYQRFHSDLLWRRTGRSLFRPLFIGRTFEALLSQGPTWEQPERIIDRARDQLDDYIGYRPIAVLEGDQKVEPYRHEWIRPCPLYIESAGVSHGPYSNIIAGTIEILHATDDTILRDAWFDPALMEELAVDPRAYDFDHPVNKRPNYHFGQWDPNRIDQNGFYRRFVLQPVVLEALASRVESASADRSGCSFDRGELEFEAAAVLAGTMLMASGTCGSGPTAHDSDTTLATLLPHIARYRDNFYDDLLARAEGAHGERLRAEAERQRQPFAGARQHLNQEMANRRAVQLQHVHLAQVFARMGYPEAAMEQAHTVRVASARMLSEIYCRLTEGHHAIDAGDVAAVTETLPEIESLLHRAIECGALVDPWNVIGFGGNFSLFPALENTVHDYRVDDLIVLVEQVVDLCSRAWTEAAARDDEGLEKSFETTLHRLSSWWDQFATPMVSDVRRFYAKETEISTNLVAGALNAWHKAGSAAGDVSFWGMFVDQFDSPKAFQLVIEALLEQGDRVASMALMMRWLCQVEHTPLEDGDASFHPLAERWLRMTEAYERESGEDQWPAVERFFAHLEANAEEMWHAPEFEYGEGWESDLDSDPLDDLLGDGEDDDLADAFEEGDEDDYGQGTLGADFSDTGYDAPFEDDEEEDRDLFGAAYDDMTFEDSSDDGMQGPVFDPDADDETDYELEAEAERLEERLDFLRTVAGLWKHAAVAWGVGGADADGRRAALAGWEREATERVARLGELLEAVHTHQIPQPRGDHESMVAYDRRRSIKDTMVEMVIAACVEMSDAGRLLRAAASNGAAATREEKTLLGQTIAVLRGVLRGDADAVRSRWGDFTAALLERELLYIPLSKGGDPRRIVNARATHQLIHDLLGWLPRLGMVRETCELLDVAQRMEVDHPVGRGAVTEYDRLFENGYQAIVRCLVASADAWDASESGILAGDSASGVKPSDGLLVQALQDLTESQLERWLRHSRTVRLSVVERLGSKREWLRFVDFVKRFGADLFTQKFLNLSNLRAILHQRVGVWLDNITEDEEMEEIVLFQELGKGITREEAAPLLAVAIEAVVENYREYRDYNVTTTMSDHGEMLYVFVDFLRLRSGYDRVVWNLTPVFLAHKILVRKQRHEAAELWRRAVAERTSEAADSHSQAYHKMCEAYGMRLSSVAERIAERFVRPLTIDRLRALVGAAIDQSAHRQEGASPVFDVMREEIEALMQEPCGAGLDAPDWITALEDEVTIVRQQRRHQLNPEEYLPRIDQVRLSWTEVQKQLSEAPQ
ncbi:hypothetical protein Mal64_22340 [Pseudobythopirellula maris]|uniref:Uncharacterized protein n=1 Tax=Pseudobythopirellula maris TaxID=2527991 RepID=A0A5C5ZNP1_9BACT|nr:hypothetical protein [Pseudobythopirellula maris]TWT88746.1 hypothetical protein Mal64_22340 [Pseudobythopirellula maris]